MVVVCRFERGDAEALLGFLTREEWPFHVDSRVDPAIVLERLARGYFDSDGTRTFWLILEEQRAGLIRLEDVGRGTPLFDLRIAAQHRGKGVGTHAVQWLTRYLFDDDALLRRIEATTRQDNAAMRRVLERCGYVKEAHYRQDWAREDGDPLDTVGYAMLRTDWESGATTPVEWDR